MNIRGNRVVLFAASWLFLLIGHAVASEAEPEPKVEPVTFQRAIELALKHSTAIAIADLDQRRAERGYAEARAAYTPQVNIGAGLGYSSESPHYPQEASRLCEPLLLSHPGPPLGSHHNQSEWASALPSSSHPEWTRVHGPPGQKSRHLVHQGRELL